MMDARDAKAALTPEVIRAFAGLVIAIDERGSALAVAGRLAELVNALIERRSHASGAGNVPSERRDAAASPGAMGRPRHYTGPIAGTIDPKQG
jgi:hypothetical protein